MQYTVPVRFLSNCSRDSDGAGCVMPLLNSDTQDRELVRKTAFACVVATACHRYSKIKGKERLLDMEGTDLRRKECTVNRLKNFRRLPPYLARIGSAQVCHFWA